MLLLSQLSSRLRRITASHTKLTAQVADDYLNRIFEEELQTAVDARTESLQTLRELGPPDLVHLIKQPIKGASKQVRLLRFNVDLGPLETDILT